MWTFGEYWALVLDAAMFLEKLPAGRGDTVFLVGENAPELPALYLGALLAGVRIAAVGAEKTQAELAELFAMLPHVAVVSNGAEERGFTRWSPSRGQPPTAAALDRLWEARSRDPLLVTFTSGTTGVPKGVIHSFSTLAASAAGFNRRFGFGASNCFYHQLPMTYMAGILNTFFLPLLAGARIVVGERFSAANVARFWDAPAHYGVNVIWFTPSIAAMLLRFDRGTEGQTLGRTRSIVGLCGTAPLDDPIRVAFEERYQIPIYESYGLSETLFVSTHDPSTSARGNSVGRPLDGVEVRVLDDGELAVRVPWAFHGYTNVDTSPYFAEGHYRTGDLGETGPDGVLRITGRKKDLIIRGGVNVSPRRIEQFLLRSGLFEELAVVGVPHRELGEATVCAFVPSARYSEHAQKELTRHLRSSLGRDHQVDRFVRVDLLPRNENGKTDRNTIRRQELARQ